MDLASVEDWRRVFLPLVASPENGGFVIEGSRAKAFDLFELLSFQDATKGLY